MKILPLNAFNSSSRASLNARVSRPSFEQKADSVTFSGLFGNKETISEADKQISDEINRCIETTAKSLKTVDAQIKRHYFIMSEMFRAGENNHYLSYTTFGSEKDHEKIIFGERDPETNTPVSLTHVKMEGGLQSVVPIKGYTLYTGGLFNVQLFTVEGYDVSMTGSKKGILYYSERDKKTGHTKEITPSKGGFHFLEAITDEDGNTKKTIREVVYNKKDPSKSRVSWPDDEVPNTNWNYKYDKTARAWRLDKGE